MFYFGVIQRTNNKNLKGVFIINLHEIFRYINLFIFANMIFLEFHIFYFDFLFKDLIHIDR